MRRFAIFLLGILYGLLLTWFFLYTYSRIEWPEVRAPASHGCHELGHCPIRWWAGTLLLVYLLAPALLFGLLNALAYHRWSRRKWALSLGIGTLLTGLLYLEPYVDRLL
ncbi:hypothetical protein NUV26_28050 [Burkholderia pseudomultivorans]|uniref:hypothetical protein n=1 Tax=Burkholderia pseudomultivorans TaxID=1207504 RepID=UPI0007554DA0|nr:hypothetical protein [Burkholderia pseudomultivorans]KVC29085.1 hypothetical protein WS56_20215 [Burkholderia pseudomultivorans]KVC35922.1 hypothetical protein WS55_31195 [Burkholderia pseudomultivorans]KVC45366.1 hypothetical protein WS58_13820 [Burkholderia pseudomultivorans]MDS0796032.1 hypothetical protein [Burkholderia pseudomultivorans]